MVQSRLPLPPGKTGMTVTPWLDPVMGHETNRASGGFLNTDMQMEGGREGGEKRGPSLLLG